MSKGLGRELASRVWTEMWNQRDVSVIAELFTEDFVNHALPGSPVGVAPMERMVQFVTTGFSDTRCEIRDTVVEGDRVVQRITTSGTHDGVFRGISPTGRHVEFDSIHIFRLEGDKIAEHWGVRDEFARMEQLGVLPKDWR